MIKVRRLSNAIDYNMPYRVLIDGKRAMELTNDTIKQYDVIGGKHTIKIVSDDYVSEEISFEVYDGEIVEFECYPDHKDSKFTKTFRKIAMGRYGIELKLKGDFYL